MPKFIITTITNYEVEADSIEDLRAEYHKNGLDEMKYEVELQDGSTSFRPAESGE